MGYFACFLLYPCKTHTEPVLLATGQAPTKPRREGERLHRSEVAGDPETQHLRINLFQTPNSYPLDPLCSGLHKT